MPDKLPTEAHTIRHSASHMLAAAVLEMFPEAKLGTGPATDEGFYYDFLLPRPLVPEDLPLIEKKVKHLIKQNQKFERYEEPVDKAHEFFRTIGQPFKAEIVEDLKQKGETVVSFYKNGNFVDLCAGPHVAMTKEIGAIKLTKFGASYWRGDETRDSMQRIYGIAFGTQEELQAYEKMLEEAKKRDHRKLGKELELFAFDEDVGPGLPLWLPRGAKIIHALEELAMRTEECHGYQRVRTPHLAKEKLYLTSGHLPYYAESMFPPMELDGEKYYLKAMNCPHHHKIYGALSLSYRDLPLRLAEYGTCYRYEDSGALFGLMRVRSMQMNDAHIYCTPEQFRSEFLAVIELYKYYFEIFGITKFQMRLSKHSPEKLGKKYVNEPELWRQTEADVRGVLEESGVPFVEAEDEAAFYGPKIDVQIWSAIGREFTLATNQLDFAVPKRFGLTYIDKDGKAETPLCIHRAPLSTHERFIGFLIEHYAGSFPAWLAPEQARIVPVAQDFAAQCRVIENTLKAAGLRVTLDDSSDTLGKKVRNAEKMKLPYILVVGEKELADGAVTVRERGVEEQKTVKIAEFVELIRAGSPR